MPSFPLNVKSLRDQRGIALPMALLALLILSTLVIAFSLLATSEPLISANQKLVAQARAVTESGLEQAIWALNNPTDPNGLPTPLPGTVPAPYDGSAPIPILVNGTQIGVVFVTVTNGINPNDRNVVAVGWAPTNAGSGAKAHQKIQATVSRFLFSATPPPAALTVQGQINITGNTNIDSRADTSCGAKDGTWSVGATTVGGSGDVYGADGNNTANQSALSGITDVKQNVPTSAFAPFLLKNQDLNTLKAMAKAAGTYYSGAGVSSLTFNSGNPMPNGIIFIDTVSGLNIDANGANTTSSSDFANVSLHGNAPADPSGVFRGMIIVAGSLSISGNFHAQGLVYAVNDLVYTGTGTGLIEGAVMSQNIRDISSTTIDTNTGGNSSIVYNCGYASNPGGQMPQGFTVQPGTYKEVSGS
ncbi:MAG TPA: hypothetical protein VK535_01035 [Gemmatimonadales bacterium]|nr:hypothetical protein [Gemmatimonadales bacterium]